MESIKNNSNTKLIAHRGLSSVYLENTVPAFVLAGKTKFVDAIECDINFTSDNNIVVFHDKTLKRLNGNKVFISKTPLFVLLKYKLFDKRDGVIDKGYSICRFSKYIKICKKYKKTAVIEIKTNANQSQLNLFINKLIKYKYYKNVIIISAYQKVLLYLRKKLPYTKMQLIVSSPVGNKLNFCLKNKFDLSIYHKILKKETVSIFHKYNLQVSVWTVNNLELIKKYLSLKVDYITSDYPFNLKSL